MMKALLDSQTKAISKLQQYKVGALFMEAGTGTTRPAVELANSINPDYVLYFAPYQAINAANYSESIKYQVELWGGFDCQHDFVGIESLSNSDRIYLELYSKVDKAKRPVIIVDESLKIKNWNAIRTKRIVRLGQLAEYKLILNGTPLSRNLLDLWAQMEFLSPKILRMGQAEYKNTFCEYLTIDKRLGNRLMTKEFIVGYHNVDYLYKLIEPYVFEADLQIDTKKHYFNLSFSLSEEEKDEHDQLKEKYLDDERMEFRNNNIFLEITQKLQHNYSLSPEKFAIVNRLLATMDKSKVIIVAKYIDSQAELKQRFPGVRILSWQKNSFALNLQQYNVLIKWDKHWDYALHDQIEHRIYRQGQTEDCRIYNLTGNVGLENLMNKNVDKKGKLLEYFKRKSVKELKKVL